MYYINLCPSIICCPSSGSMHISFGITYFACMGVIDLLGAFCDASLRALCVILVATSVLLLSMKPPIDSANF